LLWTIAFHLLLIEERSLYDVRSALARIWTCQTIIVVMAMFMHVIYELDSI